MRARLRSTAGSLAPSDRFEMNLSLQLYETCEPVEVFAPGVQMTISRRTFLRHVSLIGAMAAARSGRAGHDMPVPPESSDELVDTNALVRYVDPLPMPPIMRKSGMRASPV